MRTAEQARLCKGNADPVELESLDGCRMRTAEQARLCKGNADPVELDSLDGCRSNTAEQARLYKGNADPVELDSLDGCRSNTAEQPRLDKGMPRTFAPCLPLRSIGLARSYRIPLHIRARIHARFVSDVPFGPAWPAHVDPAGAHSWAIGLGGNVPTAVLRQRRLTNPPDRARL